MQRNDDGSERALDRVLDDRYTLHDLIGRGGMGEVWAGTDTRLARPVAVKILAPHLAELPAARQRFEYEASSAAGLAHPNIVTVFDCGESDGVPYLVMERLPGSTLADELRRGPVPTQRAVELAGEILGGLQCAHAAGVVHRDVKPANVLITEDGHAKVADFGIAKAIESSDATVTMELLATPYYLAPERLHGHPATPGSDLFAVGVVTYEMLTGERPFAANSPLEVMRVIEANEFVPLRRRCPDLPPALADTIDRALAVDPADRFADATTMAAAIARSARGAGHAGVVAHDATAATVPIETDQGSARTHVLEPSRRATVDESVASDQPARPRGRRRKRRRGALIAGLLTLIVALAVTAGVLVLDDGDASAPIDGSPAFTAPAPGPAAPLPDPLERAIRDLERLVQP